MANIALYVGDKASLTQNEPTLKSVLETAHTVTVIDSTDITDNTAGSASDLDPYDVVVIGNNWTAVADRSVPIKAWTGPVIFASSNGITDLGLADTNGSTSYNADIIVSDQAHPVMSELGWLEADAARNLIGDGNALTWDSDTVTFGAGVEHFLHLSGDTTLRMGFGYDTGAALTSGNAAGDRLVFPCKTTNFDGTPVGDELLLAMVTVLTAAGGASGVSLSPISAGASVQGMTVTGPSTGVTVSLTAISAGADPGGSLGVLDELPVLTPGASIQAISVSTTAGLSVSLDPINAGASVIGLMKETRVALELLTVGAHVRSFSGGGSGGSSISSIESITNVLGLT